MVGVWSAAVMGATESSPLKPAISMNFSVINVANSSVTGQNAEAFAPAGASCAQ